MDNQKKSPQWVHDQYQQFLTSIPDATLIIDKAGAILFANEAAINLFGYTNEEILESSVDSLLPDNAQIKHKSHMSHYLQNPWPRPMGLSMDLTAKHKNGQDIPVLISLFPQHTENELNVTVYIRDNTEHKAIESELHQAKHRLEELVAQRTAELQSANKALRQEIEERERIQEELRLLTVELTQRQRELMRELQSFEKYPAATPLSVTASTFNLLPLSESLPEIFNELVSEYEDILDHALEAQTYKVDYDISEALRTLADKLGHLNAGPHDVVMLHSTALKQKGKHCSSAKASAYIEEGRILVLKLMGYLAAHYRNYSVRFPKKRADSDKDGNQIKRTVQED
jgi:PAS domain S-box-containing protein